MTDQSISTSPIPQHVAIIMDGNGRWAKQRGEQRVKGHQNGVQPIRDVVETAAKVGVKYLTLYAFSTENWTRPKDEVDALMTLLASVIESEVSTLHKNNVRLSVIGDIPSLPSEVQMKLQEACKFTGTNTGLTLTLALSYSARWEILEAIKKYTTDILNKKRDIHDLTENTFKQYLETANMPDPELMIRTSGEQRISNFLLWQLAYTELYFTEVLWPDFGEKDFIDAIIDFQQRERRFGKTSEQL
ncbi:MAG: isoprenyl transferase [Prevotellaceae bacterium]|jgi:undecaprenyl diphosphate synthase|nr:isoprenyl transferase [Prevotellaceae bacterium]